MKRKLKSGNPIDVVVGENLRKLRVVRGVSQGAVAEGCNITFQQIQKYEAGKNRMSASAIVAAANFLNCDVGEFFAGTGLRPPSEVAKDFTRDTMEMVKVYNNIPAEMRPHARKIIAALAVQA